LLKASRESVGIGWCSSPVCRGYFRKKVSSADVSLRGALRIQREKELLEKLEKMPENRKASRGVSCGMICEGE